MSMPSMETEWKASLTEGGTSDRLMSRIVSANSRAEKKEEFWALECTKWCLLDSRSKVGDEERNDGYDYKSYPGPKPSWNAFDSPANSSNEAVFLRRWSKTHAISCLCERFVTLIRLWIPHLLYYLGHRPARRLSSGLALLNFALRSGFVRCAYRSAIAKLSCLSTCRTSSRSPVCRRMLGAA